jgi:anti-sigma factor RsiW
MSAQQPGCPRTAQLSALVDDELPDRPRQEIESHAATCPACGAMLRDLTELRLALRPLSETQPGVELAPLIEPRLAPRSRRQAQPRAPWWQVWQLLPPGVAAAGVLAAGAYLGALLVGGAAVSATQSTTMAVFDPIPPGGICAGMQSCFLRGK